VGRASTSVKIPNDGNLNGNSYLPYVRQEITMAFRSDLRRRSSPLFQETEVWTSKSKHTDSDARVYDGPPANTLVAILSSIVAK
jgi:hypothetical protein